MNDNLSDVLIGFGIVSTFSKQLFSDKSNILELLKNQIIFAEGKKNNFEYILISGVVHRYNISDKGDEVTTGFYMAPSVITPHCLTDVVIAEIPVTDLDDLRYNNKEYNEFGQQTVRTHFL